MQEADETAEWPERFVYVCSAGGAANVNIVPMLRAGRRVAGVAILVGLSQPGKKNSSDFRFAVAPAQRIAAYARESLGLEAAEIIKIESHADLIGDWQDKATELAHFIRARGGVAVFNLTGGRVATKFGTMLGLALHKDIQVHYLTVGLEEFAVRLVSADRIGRLKERRLPVEDGVDLDTYLGTHGLVEHKPDKRRHRETWLKENAEVAQRYLTASQQNWFRDFQVAILQRLPNTEGQDPSLPFVLNLERGEAARLAELTAGLRGLECDGNRVIFYTADALKFVQGTWLEGGLLSRVTAEFAGRNSVSFAASVEIARAKSSSLTDGEIDLLVLSNDQLSIVECKAIVGTRRLKKDIDALSALRAELCGQGGQALMVLPLLDRKKIYGGGHAEHARERGVNLLFGPTALDMTMKLLKSYHLPRA